MTREEDLVAEIIRLLPDVQPLVSSSDDGSDLYEAFLFGAVVSAAESEGAHIWFKDVHGQQQTQLTFRTSPGYISSRAHPYSHAELVFPNRPQLEVHLGVRVAGNSHVAHECDVSVIKKAEADRCRAVGALPRSTQLILALEAKFYTANLPLGLARAFLGLRTDLGNRDVRFVANISSPSIAALLAARSPASWHENVVPDNTYKLDGALRQVFANYRARR